MHAELAAAGDGSGSNDDGGGSGSDDDGASEFHAAGFRAARHVKGGELQYLVMWRSGWLSTAEFARWQAEGYSGKALHENDGKVFVKWDDSWQVAREFAHPDYNSFKRTLELETANSSHT